MGIEHTTEQKLEISRKVCDKYSTGEYTIDSCADSEGITGRTFNLWVNDISEISELYKAAKQQVTLKQRGNLKQAALTSLMKLVVGHETEETHQEVEPIYDANGKQIGTQAIKLKKIKKQHSPHVTAVIFALKSMDPETFKDNIPPAQLQEQEFIIGGKSIKF